MDEGEPRVRRAKIGATVSLGAIGLIAVVMISALVLVFVPYHPITYYAYEPDSTEVCPGTPVGFIVDREVADDASIREVSIYATWKAVDVSGYAVGQEVSAGEFEPQGQLPDVEPGRKTTTSRYLRSAPGVSGEWQAITRVQIRGSAYDMFHVEETEIEASQTTSVLEPSDSRCAKGG